MHGTDSALRIASDVRKGERSAEAVVRERLRRIDAVDSELNAFISVNREGAIQRAKEIDQAVADGIDPGPLAGVPIAIKDNICTAGTVTSCGSRSLQQFKPPYNATAVDRLERAGAIVIGKTNLDEFGMGSSTENSAFFTTRNPWNTDFVAGGSSGGSAAAVGAGLVPVALGSDTGGSVRQPASFCGVVGLKPTYGSVSRYGLVAFGSSLDQIGVLASSVDDAAAVLQVIAGKDPRDSTSVDQAAFMPRPEAPRTSDQLRIGICEEYFGDGLDAGVEKTVRAAIDELREAGYQTVPVALPHMKYACACYYLIASAEASSNLARFDGIHYGHRTDRPGDITDLYQRSRDESLGMEVKRRIMLGTYALSHGYYDAFYLKALKVRTLIKRDFDAAFKQVDLLASPVAPTPPFRLGEKTDDPLTMYLNDIYTISANLAGICALSVPCGLSDDRLPIGLQLMGPAFGDQPLLAAANTLEQRIGFHLHTPAVQAASEELK